MKKGAIVIVTGTSEKMLSEVLKVIEDKKLVVIANYYDEDNIPVLSDEMKVALDIEEEYDVSLVSIDAVEEIVPADIAKIVHPDGNVVLDLPGFTVKFRKKEHLQMWEEFVHKFYPLYEVMVYDDKKLEVIYPDCYMDRKTTMLERRMIVTAFKNSINLSYCPIVEEKLVPLDYPEICAIGVDLAKYIRKEIKEEEVKK